MKAQSIVIIEDEDAHFKLMERALHRELPYLSIMHFDDAPSFLDTLDQIRPEIIIVDFLLPGMNGIEFLEALQQKGRAIPVIMITGQGDEMIAVRAMKMGAADYLVKSADFFALLPSTVEKVIREKKLEESLCKTERRFRDLAECTSDWIWETDMEGSYTYSNPMVERILGHKPGEIVGLHFYDLFSEYVKDSQQFVMCDLMKSRSSISGLENRLIHKDGHEVIVETSAVPIIDSRGMLLGYRGIDRDISKRRRSQRALKLSHRFLEIGNKNTEMSVLLGEFLEEIKQFTRCSAGGIRILDEQGNIPYQAYYGFSREFCDLESPLSIKSDRCMCVNVITQETNPNLECYTQRGSYYINSSARFLETAPEDNKGPSTNACNRFGYESIALLPIRLENQVMGLVHIADQRENMISLEDLEILENAVMELGTAIERVRTRESLHRAKDELEQRVRERTSELACANQTLKTEVEERKKAEEALRKSSEDLKRFAFSVMHDLKSPAVGIYGLSRLLQRKYGQIVDANGQSYCDQIAKASEHIAALVEKINHFIISKETPLEIERIFLNKILHMIKDEFSARLGVREIQWIQPNGSTEIYADQLALMRALRNLVDNALKYGGPNLSRIRIGYESTEQSHIISVADNGIGIKPEDQEKIFGLFERNASSRGIEGAGLGLNIVREVAHRHSGEIRVSSEPGKGTVFCLSIAKDLIDSRNPA